MATSQTRIVWLDARANADERTIGPKAFSLVRMSRIGLKVPAGFCVVADAYREHVEANGIGGRITSVLDSLVSASPENRTSILREIRQAITEAPLKETTRRAIEDHYRRLGTKRVAVRSSATAEDLPGQSFAGQYDTHLGVVGLDGCLAAVRQCWASLWTERAWDYRQKSGFDHRAVSMAVIVQSLVAADASGVLFTADPGTGRTDRIVIEACFGLGEAVVSGQVTPDRFVLAKRDLRLISQTISEKKVETVPDKQGTVHCRPVAQERMSRAAIDRHTTIRLARRAKKAEAKLGGPQDMEWAVRRREIFFLQSRPITTLPAAPSWEDRQVWTNANLGEVLPDAITPMTYSFVYATGSTLLDPALTMVGAEHVNKEEFARLIAGRLYFNVNAGWAVLRRIPGARHVDLQKLLGGGRAAPERGSPEITEEDLPDLHASTVKMILRLPSSLRAILAHRQKKTQASIRRIRAKSCQLQDVDFSRLSLEELARAFIATAEDGLAAFDLLDVVPAMAPVTILYKVCERWLGDTDGALANGLLVGMGDMASAQAGLDLWRLAAEAREAPPVRQALLSGGTWKTTRETLLTSDAGRTFLQSWDRFMSCHGHHCRGELELYNQRWSEMPDYLLRLVRGYLTHAGTTDPLQSERERARRRRQLQEHCRRQLKNPLKRRVFQRLLRAAQNGSLLRENLKNEGMRWMMNLRRMLLELGTRLTGPGMFGAPDDVFFLQLPELTALLQGAADLDVSQVVAARRAEYEKNKSITPPKVVVGRFDPATYVPPAVDPSARVLTGVAASAGVATGPARVILRSDLEEQLRPGEVLVAPFTDPGWTPYFVPAAGIVVEQGGLLSHGSIIAREYGIPAVVNVPGATRIIRTGQALRVDGGRGTVTILD